MHVRSVQSNDVRAWQRMRERLWPSGADDHAREIAAFFDGARVNPAEVLVAFDDHDEAIGFAELSIRHYAEGCRSGRVAYLEGWFVEESWRRRGVGAALVTAAEAWGRDQGCSELASDAEIENTDSAAAQLALGFEEAGRIVCFRKAL